MRAINLAQGDRVDEKAFAAMVRAAIALNLEDQAKAKPARGKA